jgi:NADH dehydrogenase
VVIGAGFGGLRVTQALARAPVSITVLDRRNHHLFQPLLYQVATAALSPGDIAAPIRWILRKQKNVQVFLAEVKALDLNRRVVRLDEREIPYDYLVVATGATHAYFGHEDWAPFAPGLKTLDDALAIRRRILVAFERAERETDVRRQRVLLTFVIIGGGPTGVELAGALAEIAHHALVHDFRRIDPEDARIVLVEGGDHLLGAFPPNLRAHATEALRRLRVEVRLGQAVTKVESGIVHLGSERLEAGTILWAAGVAASPLGRCLGVPLDRAGRVMVEPDLSIPGHRDVFVVGDLAAFMHQGARPLPGVAPVALQQASHVARSIVAAIGGRPSSPFRYHDPGNLATIGRADAVFEYGSAHLTGLLAWLIWLFVHILNLIGFRNRFAVMTEWAWSYLTYQRSVRLITGHATDTPSTS